jgi:hypothetical protein
MGFVILLSFLKLFWDFYGIFKSFMEFLGTFKSLFWALFSLCPVLRVQGCKPKKCSSARVQRRRECASVLVVFCQGSTSLAYWLLFFEDGPFFCGCGSIGIKYRHSDCRHDDTKLGVENHTSFAAKPSKQVPLRHVRIVLKHEFLHFSRSQYLHTASLGKFRNFCFRTSLLLLSIRCVWVFVWISNSGGITSR